MAETLRDDSRITVTHLLENNYGTRKDVAAIGGISEWTVRDMVRKSRLPPPVCYFRGRAYWSLDAVREAFDRDLVVRGEARVQTTAQLAESR